MTNPTWSSSESRTLTRFSESTLILTLTVASSLHILYINSQIFASQYFHNYYLALACLTNL